MVGEHWNIKLFAHAAHNDYTYLNMHCSAYITMSALTNVFYSAAVTDDNSEKTNKGIVMYDLTHNVYVAIEFENDALSDEQYSYIANSLYFAREQ